MVLNLLNSVQQLGIYTNGVDESDNVNTDWQDLFYRTGMVTSHDLRRFRVVQKRAVTTLAEDITRMKL